MSKSILKRLTASLLIFMIICSAFMTGFTALADEINTQTQEIYSLPDHFFYTLGSPNIGTVSLPRGNNHDRQHLGIYLKAGDTLTIRLSSANAPSSPLIIDFLANDNRKERQYTVYDEKEPEGITVTAEYDCVPMIKTPIDDNGATYEVEFSVKTLRKLPVYVKGEDQKAFFDEWDASESPYGLIESDRVIMLIPTVDKWRIGPNDKDNANDKKYKFRTLDEMLGYFGDMLEQYDRFAGLDKSEDADPWNRWIPSRYLLKLDNNGAGLAYYSEQYVAMNGQATNDSIDNYFFMADWLNTHELGHGYSVVLCGSDKGEKLNVTEVWNNIYGYYYELITKSEEDFWLPRTESALKERESNRVNYGYYGSPDDTWGGYYKDMLFFWLNIFDLDPEYYMSELNRRYREDVYKGNDRVYKGADLYAKYLMEISGYNLIPYFEDWGIEISDSLKEKIIKSGEYKNINSLRFFTATDAQADGLIPGLKMDSVRDRYSLVPTEKLQNSGLKGTVRINIDIDNINELHGQKIKITDGVNTVAEPTVNGETVTAELPIGSYNIIFPATVSGKYAVDQRYQFVNVASGSSSAVSAAYTVSNGDFLADYTISYLGLADAEYFNASYSLENGTMQISRKNTQPHGYFDGSYLPLLYSTFEVKDTAGNVVFSNTQNGNEAKAVNQEIPIAVGYVINILHQEASSRLKIFATPMKGIDYTEFSSFPKGTAMSFRITEYGLEPIGNVSYTTAKDPQEAYKNRLEAYFSNLIDNYPPEVWSDKDELVSQKASIIGAVENKLSDEQAESFKNAFSGIYGLFDSDTDVSGREELLSKIEEAKAALETAVGKEKRKALEDAIAYAEIIASDEEASDDYIALALYTLEIALAMEDDGNTSGTDKAKLMEKLEEAAGIFPTTLNTAKKMAINIAIAKGYDVLNDPDATQEQIDEAIRLLEEALAMSDDPDEAYKAELEEWLAQARKQIEDGVNSEAKRRALDEAINYGQSVFDNSAATQSEVNDAVQRLQDAVGMADTPPVSIKLGDVTNDGAITSLDATVVLQYAAGIVDRNDSRYEYSAADVSGDGAVTSLDATYILQHAAGLLPNGFPAEKT